MRTFVEYRDREIVFIRKVTGESKDLNWMCSFCRDSYAWSEGKASLLWDPYGQIRPETLKPIVFDRPPFRTVLSDGNAYDFCGSSECVRSKALLVGLEVQNQVLIAAIKKIAEKLS